MDENHQDKTESKTSSTQDQEKLDHLQKKHNKAKQILIVVAISAAFVGVMALIYTWFRFNWPLWVLVLLMLMGILLLILLIQVGYTPQWTGFRGYNKETKEYTPDGQLAKITKEYQPGKTFWDWLQLLIIPLVLASATIGFGLWQAHLADLQHDADQQRALDQQRAAILQTYTDNMQDLMLKYNLLKSNAEDPFNPYIDVATLAQARTLTALQSLDAPRKARIVQFLHEAHLIGYFDISTEKFYPYTFSLSGADLTGVYLDGDLTGVYLDGADLRDAHLEGADLRGAHLDCAFSKAHDIQSCTNLSGANLSGAMLGCLKQLNGIELKEVCVSLSGARYNRKPIQVKDAQGNFVTLMPTQWPQGFDFKAAGASCVDC